MKRPGWVVVQVKRCAKCRIDYPKDRTRCPRCGGPLIEKMLRVRAEES